MEIRKGKAEGETEIEINIHTYTCREGGWWEREGVRKRFVQGISGLEYFVSQFLLSNSAKTTQALKQGFSSKH